MVLNCVMFGSKKALPAQSSVLGPAPLLDAAREHYAIERGATCALVHHGINDTYVIEAPGQHFALRVYRHAHRTNAEIQWELSLLEHLDAEDAPVAPPVRTRSGNRFSMVLAPEGPRPVALFEFAQGKPCRTGSMTPPHARSFGRAVASVHLRMDTYQAEHPRFELDLDYLLIKPIAALAPYMSEREHDLTYLRRLADDIREAVVEFDARGLVRGLCHGGTTTRNAHLDQRGDFTLFDFDSAGAGWRTYDLASFRWETLRNFDRRRADEVFNAFLEGYREVRGLLKVDEEAIPPFVAARQICLMGTQAAKAVDEGSALMDEAYFDQSINFLHDWYKEMLAYS